MASELSDAAGLSKLEKEANMKIKAAKKAAISNDTKGAHPNNDEEVEQSDSVIELDPWAPGNVQYSMYANHCTDEAVVEVVRKHLDGGALKDLLALYKTTMNGWTFMYGNDYIFVLIGALAMTVGCKLPKSLKSALMKKYKIAGFLPEAVAQMQKALLGPDGYKDGEPYDFGSLGLVETANLSPTEDEEVGSAVMSRPDDGSGELEKGAEVAADGTTKGGKTTVGDEADTSSARAGGKRKYGEGEITVDGTKAAKKARLNQDEESEG